jgi:hypothetical protein
MENNLIKSKIKEILKIQKSRKSQISLDVLLHNGNILMKSFRLYDFTSSTDLIKGLTMHEEYAFLRENREPVFAYFNLSEINDIEISDSSHLFLSKPIQMANR